ncbi:formate dehydrogenase subunit gamma [Aquibaculum sediminis]|uniref:formate dehydrogenase subunit gamma n=1 Tax=Aquibaculum sediminis TaxID=3231907 RepID=UPI0034549504
MVRAIGGLAALVFLALLVWTLYSGFSSSDRVVPTDGVIGGGTPDPVAENAADYSTLVERAQLQRWRGDTGPSPEGEQTPVATDEARSAEQTSEERVELWLSRTEAQGDLLQPRRFVEGQSVLPGEVLGVFSQPQGRSWRAFRNNWVVFGGGVYIFGISALLALFLAWRGRVRVEEGFAGESIVRFNAFERANHWMTAVSFVLLALTGVVILYGRDLIRPWLGPQTFADLASGSAWLHIALIIPFTIGLIVMFFAWIAQNLPKRVDWEWLKRGGGMGREQSLNPPAPKFNAGQKLVFWLVILGGLVLVASGLSLMFPFLWLGYSGMELSQTVHVVVGLLMIGVIIGHIYIGTIGMEGAFEAMWSGRVDRNWAKEHHSLWFEDLLTKGKARSHARRTPATREPG